VRGFSRNVKLHFACILLRSAAFALFELFLNLYVLSLGFEPAFIGRAARCWESPAWSVRYPLA
jgi:hypothetical protein